MAGGWKELWKEGWETIWIWTAGLNSKIKGQVKYWARVLVFWRVVLQKWVTDVWASGNGAETIFASMPPSLSSPIPQLHTWKTFQSI